jgi:hypothetical protein
MNNKKNIKKKSFINNIKSLITDIINVFRKSFTNSNTIIKGITLFLILLSLVILILGFLYKDKATIKREKILFNLNDPTMQSFSNLNKKSIVENNNIDKNGNFLYKYNKENGIFIQKDTNIKLQMRTNNKYNNDYFEKYKIIGPKTNYSNFFYIYDIMNKNRLIMNPKTKNVYLNLAIK